MQAKNYCHNTGIKKAETYLLSPFQKSEHLQKKQKPAQDNQIGLPFKATLKDFYLSGEVSLNK